MIEALRAIPIPAEHAWTVQRAEAWWAEHRPLEQRSKPTSPGQPRTLVAKLSARGDR
ncbi:MAG TPA: hypothetical protein VGC41_06695 [Kofleriaceae bacterium]